MLRNTTVENQPSGKVCIPVLVSGRQDLSGYLESFKTLSPLLP